MNPTEQERTKNSSKPAKSVKADKNVKNANQRQTSNDMDKNAAPKNREYNDSDREFQRSDRSQGTESDVDPMDQKT
jgi:hypothetical protein